MGKESMGRDSLFCLDENDTERNNFLNKKNTTKKAAAAIFPARVLSPPGRLTSEFGMGSGVSAWQSQPPTELSAP